MKRRCMGLKWWLVREASLVTSALIVAMAVLFTIKAAIDLLAR